MVRIFRENARSCPLVDPLRANRRWRCPPLPPSAPAPGTAGRPRRRQGRQPGTGLMRPPTVSTGAWRWGIAGFGGAGARASIAALAAAMTARRGSRRFSSGGMANGAGRGAWSAGAARRNRVLELRLQAVGGRQASRLTLPSWSRPIAGAMRRPSVNSPAHSSRQRVRTSARVRWPGWGLAPLKRHARAAGEHPGGRAVAPPRPPPRRGVGPRAGTGVSRHPLTPSARSDDRHHEPRQRVLGPGLLHRRREPVRRILIPLTQLAARRQTRAYDAPALGYRTAHR